MRKIILFIFFGILTMQLFANPTAHALNIQRQKINLNTSWKFELGNQQAATHFTYNDKNWQNVNIPHSFSTPYFQTAAFYQGYGTYRKYIDIPKDWLDKDLSIEFEGAYRSASIYLNGTLLYQHQNGYTGFNVPLNSKIHAGKNILTVIIHNLWEANLTPRAGDHNFWGGIYRNVWLHVKHKTHIAWYGTYITTPHISKKSSDVEIQTEITNHDAKDKILILKSSIIDQNQHLIQSNTSKIKILKNSSAILKQISPQIKNIQLWSPKSPILYKVISSLYEANKKIDEYETEFGFRWVEWDKDKGFSLNGIPYYFKGVNAHQDHAGWANAVTNNGFKRDITLIKEAGFDFIRGSHYPHSPFYSEMCDRLGMLFWQENAFWGIGGSNGDHGYTSSSAYPPDPKDGAAFEESVISNLKEMIKIHRNHPSIIVWSMCNEPFFTDQATLPAVKKFLKKLVLLTHELDPSRKVALGGVQRGDLDTIGDIAGYNGDGATLFMHPNIPNLVSEYGSTIEDRPGSYSPGWGLLQAEKYPWRSGEVLWCAFDYGTSGGKFGTMGMIDYYRIPKRMWYWYRNHYKHIPNPTWPEKGIPHSLNFTADKKIAKTDGTDDIQLLIRVFNKLNIPINNAIPVTLEIINGPGTFPTGKKISFSPDSDIQMLDGACAIELRSYFAGTTTIKATSPHLPPAYIILKFVGNRKFIPNQSLETTAIPYQRFIEENAQIAVMDTINLAIEKPTAASSSITSQGANKANDADKSSYWEASSMTKDAWWRIDLEKIYRPLEINTHFAYPFSGKLQISGSMDAKNWTTIIDTTVIHLENWQTKPRLENKIRFLKWTFSNFDTNTQKIGIKYLNIKGK